MKKPKHTHMYAQTNKQREREISVTVQSVQVSAADREINFKTSTIT